MCFASRKPKTTVLTVLFLPGVASITVFIMFLGQRPAKNTGNYAVFSMLQEVFFPCQSAKHLTNYSVLAFGARQKRTQQNPPKRPKWTFQTLLSSKPWLYSRFAAQKRILGRVDGRGCNYPQCCSGLHGELPRHRRNGLMPWCRRPSFEKIRALHLVASMTGIFWMHMGEALVLLGDF